MSENTEQGFDETTVDAQEPAASADSVAADSAEVADLADEVETLLDATPSSDEVAKLRAELDERTGDLQRLAAEYQNYKRRVDRDRDLARDKGIETVVKDLLPVFDAIDQADSHQELTGGFKLVADELARVAHKHGLDLYGEVGDEFDPVIHEALMQLHAPGYAVTSVSQVMQKGVRLNDRVLRPARVAVTDPDPDSGSDAEPASDKH